MAWLNIVLLVWPIVRSIAKSQGIELPDLGEYVNGDLLAHTSLVVGTAGLAVSQPVIGKK